MTIKLYDALIIGGGPAGLAMATALARQLHTALVLDSGIYRNARSKHMHNVPGWDHVDPAEFRAKARGDLLKRYETVEFKSATVTQVRKLESGEFEAVDEEGVVYRGRKLGLGTGVRDVVEGMPEGYEECWGRGIFHCLFCHGYEERGAESIGVLAGGLLSAPEFLTHVTPMAKRLASSVTVYTNGNTSLAATVRANLHSTKIHFDTRAITRLELIASGPCVRVHFADGGSKVEAFLVNHPDVEQGAPFAEQLGLERTATGEIRVGGMGNETSLGGCFAAGDGAAVMRSVVGAVNMGVVAGAGMGGQVARELDARDEL